MGEDIRKSDDTIARYIAGEKEMGVVTWLRACEEYPELPSLLAESAADREARSNQLDLGVDAPARKVLRNVLEMHGSEIADADLIVASPPCTEYSYMAMPWSRAKQIARALRGEDEFPEPYKGSRTIADLNAIFDACFRLQREASQRRRSAYPDGRRERQGRATLGRAGRVELWVFLPLG
jgi:hypothetical protein